MRKNLQYNFTLAPTYSHTAAFYVHLSNLFVKCHKTGKFDKIMLKVVANYILSAHWSDNETLTGCSTTMRQKLNIFQFLCVASSRVHVYMIEYEISHEQISPVAWLEGERQSPHCTSSIGNERRGSASLPPVC